MALRPMSAGGARRGARELTPMRLKSGGIQSVLAALTLATPAAGQSSQSNAGLQKAIVAADSALFAAFNRRDLAKLKTFFTPDLEFYQDNEGVATYAQTMKDFGAMFGQSAPI